MKDSDVKNKPQTDTENPSGVTTLVVANQHGALREVQKDEKGRFLKKKRPIIPNEEFVRSRRKRLAKVNSEGLTEDQTIIEELLECVHASIESTVFNKAGDPTGTVIDGKVMMAKIKAAEVLWLFTGGKPDPSEREMDKLETQPIKVVFVPVPADVKPMEEKKPESKQPTFAEVTGITTNPKD